MLGTLAMMGSNAIYIILLKQSVYRTFATVAWCNSKSGSVTVPIPTQYSYRNCSEPVCIGNEQVCVLYSVLYEIGGVSE